MVRNRGRWFVGPAVWAVVATMVVYSLPGVEGVAADGREGERR